MGELGLVVPTWTSIRSPVLNATLAPVVLPFLVPLTIVQVNVVSAPFSRSVNVVVELLTLAVTEQYIDVKWPLNDTICCWLFSLVPGEEPRPKNWPLLAFWALLPRRIELEPLAPVGPVDPVGPVGPVGPCAPVAPVAPVGPVGPWMPCGPVGPVGPWVPCGPVGPVGP